MDDPFNKTFNNFKEQFPYWTTFLAGGLLTIMRRIVQEGHWPVILFWFFIIGFMGLILLGVWFITTKPENRLSVAAQVNFMVWGILISYTGMSLISLPFTGVYQSMVQLGCVVGMVFVGIVIYLAIKHRTPQKDEPL